MRKIILGISAMLALGFASQNLFAETNSMAVDQQPKKELPAKPKLKTGEKEIVIKDVQGNCNMCKGNIETAAKSIAGVSYANWNVKTKTLDVYHNSDKVSSDAISKKVAEAGYDVGKKYKADDKVYNALHSCCLYRK